METARSNRRFNWQQKGWPAATVDRTALRGELAAFKESFLRVRDVLAKPLPQTLEMAALVDEAVKTSAIEGVKVDESVVMSSICKATATRDLAELAATGAVVAEGASVASRYRLAIRDSGWLNEPLFEAINEAINEPQNDSSNDPTSRRVAEIVGKSPGVGRKQLIRELGKSKATIERSLAALVAAGKVEHRGSKKTGGYYARQKGTS